MQTEISKYLVECSKEELRDDSRSNINAMLRIIHEIESISDSCFKLVMLTRKRYRQKICLHCDADTEIRDYAEIIQEFIQFSQNNVNKHLDSYGLDTAFKFENKIDNYRDTLKKQAQKRMQDGADVNAELLYLDILKNFEHIGDNSLNIAQALRQFK
jgi:phosphate:Na+ symporter